MYKTPSVAMAGECVAHTAVALFKIQQITADLLAASTNMHAEIMCIILVYTGRFY